ncbi:blue copper protein 1a-like [Vitis vinifera]|nr:blue copper protein 1a-like [Vitis vinifera]|eukprot:XP_010645994.2 PREDICTED: stellacyanin-like [Vitis vinifera]
MEITGSTVAMATEFTVGDDQGWTINFDYEAWAKDKVFHVGDKLVFKYTAGRHNVFKVNGTAFTNCTIPPANEAITTGNDVITLATPGRKWYICGVNDHCGNYGQKLVITVLEESASPAPAPSHPTAPAPNSAHGISGSGYQLLMAAMVALAFLAV